LVVIHPERGLAMVDKKVVFKKGKLHSTVSVGRDLT
jgi:hypothetical protein